LLFTFLAYIVPIFGAWVADTKIGRYKTILIGVLIGGVAHVIMVGGAAPALLQAGKGAAPFIFSLFLLAIGAGSKRFAKLLPPLLVFVGSKYCLTGSECSRAIIKPL
jgi:dipeptide/tripeptide permease